MNTHWLLTTSYDSGDFRPLTFSTHMHPAEWMAEHGKADPKTGRRKRALIFAMPITEGQHMVLEATGSFS